MSWEPTTELDRRLAESLAADDRTGFLAALVSSPLYVPGRLPESESQPQELAVERIDGVSFVPAFTSPVELARYITAAGLSGFVVTSCADLALHWPDPDWLLVLNPHLPIAVQLDHEHLVEIALGAAETDDAETPLERGLRTAMDSGDPRRVVDVLMRAEVMLPTDQAAPLDPSAPDFAWPWTELPGRGRSVVVFTSPRRAAEAMPGPSAPVAFARLLRAWPDPEVSLVIDPGAPTEIALSPAERLALTDLSHVLA